jgi:DNA-directed RNA polymerase subunit H (RpoH/RPB5)
LRIARFWRLRQGKVIEIARKKESMLVRDYGRGIPLGKVIDCVREARATSATRAEKFR